MLILYSLVIHFELLEISNNLETSEFFLRVTNIGARYFKIVVIYQPRRDLFL